VVRRLEKKREWIPQGRGRKNTNQKGVSAILKEESVGETTPKKEGNLFFQAGTTMSGKRYPQGKGKNSAKPKKRKDPSGKDPIVDTEKGRKQQGRGPKSTLTTPPKEEIYRLSFLLGDPHS